MQPTNVHFWQHEPYIVTYGIYIIQAFKRLTEPLQSAPPEKGENWNSFETADTRLHGMGYMREMMAYTILKNSIDHQFHQCMDLSELLCFPLSVSPVAARRCPRADNRAARVQQRRRG